jgi:hypothetical protein
MRWITRVFGQVIVRISFANLAGGVGMTIAVAPAAGVAGAGVVGAGLGVGVVVPVFLAMQNAVDLVLRGCQHALGISLEQVHRSDAAQEAVHRGEPNRDIPIL